MLQLRIKNLIRICIGFLSVSVPSRADGLRIYCNLMEGKVYGGPNRFLKNITSSKAVQEKITITNWSLKNCRSALIFSASWGKSFSWLCKSVRVRTVLRVDGFYVPDDVIDERFQQSLRFRQWVNQRLAEDLERFDHIIYQSNFSKAICDRYLFKRTADFSIIPNGTNLEHFVPAEIERNGPLRLIVLGKHYPKHLNLALEIFSRLLEMQDLELHIIGPMRNGADEVPRFFDELRLEPVIRNKIICHGIVPLGKLPKLLQNSDILLHVKVGDWCPNAVLEAMACGLPIVCPAWGGTKELVGEAGISVDGPEWGINEKLTQGMVDATLEVQRQLKEYKTRARKRAVANFDIEATSKKYLDVLLHEKRGN